MATKRPPQADSVEVLLERIAKAESFKADAHERLIDAARVYARMKLPGHYFENGCLTRDAAERARKHLEDCLLKEAVEVVIQEIFAGEP